MKSQRLAAISTVIFMAVSSTLVAGSVPVMAAETSIEGVLQEEDAMIRPSIQPGSIVDADFDIEDFSINDYSTGTTITLSSFEDDDYPLVLIIGHKECANCSAVTSAVSTWKQAEIAFTPIFLDEMQGSGLDDEFVQERPGVIFSQSRDYSNLMFQWLCQFEAKNINRTTTPLVLILDHGLHVSGIGIGNCSVDLKKRIEITIPHADDDNNNNDNNSTQKTGEWRLEGGRLYWYENGVRQGTVEDPKGVYWKDDPQTNRGREIYDPGTDAWYWLDANNNGARAAGKEVFMPYIYQDEAGWTDAQIRENANASDDGMQEYVYQSIKNGTGKWVRYNSFGQMMKGWVTITGTLALRYPQQYGNRYYYDHKTGLMAKGRITLNGVTYHFDEQTGALLGRE